MVLEKSPSVHSPPAARKSQEHWGVTKLLTFSSWVQSAEKKKVLLKYVKEVQPALIEQFVEHGPPAVVAAMRNTITNMLGTLPPQFFTVTISTVGENMSQLMLSVLMTGYMFRNAQYRYATANSNGRLASAPAQMFRLHA